MVALVVNLEVKLAPKKYANINVCDIEKCFHNTCTSMQACVQQKGGYKEDISQWNHKVHLMIRLQLSTFFKKSEHTWNNYKSLQILYMEEFLQVGVICN